MVRLGSTTGTMPVGWLRAAFAAVLLSSSANAVAADTSGQARILYFEPFTTTIDPRPALAQKTTRTRQLKFDAYGRRFELALEPNDKLQGAQDPAAAPSLVNLYRGKLTGVSGSWARVATRGSDVHGLIWDGTDLFVIEPSDAVRDSLVAPLDAGAVRTVLFRLSDTIVDAGASMCAVGDTETTTGATAYDSLTREINFLKRGAVLMQSGDVGLRVELGAVGDAAFRAQYSSDSEARDALLLRLNNVDGIFSAQLGIEIQVPTMLVYDSTNDPLPPTTSPNLLLEHLGSLRQNTPELSARGLTHLFTGRDLDGTTVGLGYVGAVCRARYSAALTEIRGRGAWLESLITAHEIGHNFGAVHDGEMQCEYVAENQFLMSPTVHSNAATFSSCSRNLIATSIASASCVSSLPPADLSIAANLGTVHARSKQAFEWELPITNKGGRAAFEGHVEVLIPPSLTATDIWVPGGACTSGAGTIDCELGAVTGGYSLALHMTLTGDALGTNSIGARVTSLSDANLMNNSGEATIIVASAVEPTPLVQSPPATSVPETAAGTADNGGGGSFNLTWLLSLLSLGAMRTLTLLKGRRCAHIC